MLTLTNTDHGPYVFGPDWAIGPGQSRDIPTAEFKELCTKYPALKGLCEQGTIGLSKPGVPNLLAKVLG